jgi:hypothetical protein
MAVEGVATPPAFEFTAANAQGTVGAGDELAVSGPVTLHVRSNAPDGFTTTIWDGVAAVATDRRERDFTVAVPAGPAVYRVEVRADGASSAVPWITSNAIYVRAPAAPVVVPARPPATSSRPLFDGTSAAAWSVEHDPTSLGALDLAGSTTGENSLRLRFGLATGVPAGQFAALSVPTPQGVSPGSRIAFSVRAERPMRMSVQLRTKDARWQRSIYVDTMSQPHTIFFEEFAPVEAKGTDRVPLEDVRTVLFVVDTTNTKPGDGGRLWITAPRIEW